MQVFLFYLTISPGFSLMPAHGIADDTNNLSPIKSPIIPNTINNKFQFNDIHQTPEVKTAELKIQPLTNSTQKWLLKQNSISRINRQRGQGGSHFNSLQANAINVIPMYVPL